MLWKMERTIKINIKKLCSIFNIRTTSFLRIRLERDTILSYCEIVIIICLKAFVNCNMLPTCTKKLNMPK